MSNQHKTNLTRRRLAASPHPSYGPLFHEPSEAPQVFGVRQSSGAFDWRTRIPIAPEDWRTPRRWRDNESANRFMAPMRGQETVAPPHEPRSSGHESAHSSRQGNQSRLTSAATIQEFKARKLLSENSLPNRMGRGGPSGPVRGSCCAAGGRASVGVLIQK